MSRSVRSLAITCLCAAPLTLAGCSGSEDPFGDTDSGGETDSTSDGTSGSPTSDTNTTTDGTTTDATSDSATTTDGTGGTTGGSSGAGTDSAGTTGGSLCRPTPTRYIALGDSVVDGVGVGGKQGDGNAFKMAAAYMDANYAPGIEYENYGVGGAVTTDVPDSQIGNVPVGMPGHALINIHIGGNDLAAYIFSGDQESVDGYNADIGPMMEDWDTTWAWLNDPANFPDGVTVIINGQYNPWDDCQSPHNGVSISEVKTGLIQDYNEEVEARTAMEAHGFFADTKPRFLGHGHNYDNPECPHYIEGADYWLIGGFDFIHAGAGGHAGMAEVYNELADSFYAACP